GFPQESDQEFQETLDMVRQAEFCRVHIFPYSQRQGTTSARMEDFSPTFKKEREHQLRIVCQETALAFAQRYCMGMAYQALTETAKNKKREAYTENYIRIHFPESSTDANQFLTVKPQNVQIDQDGHLLFS
ncbi:MAG: hypothetical protein ACRC0X_09930, partial [Brevinema sp.]